ncbi:hypothetical protein MMC20_001430 [Loxospora ochrophaea]|nr:hypothetical protein [Loxospora ochrophaea]
MSAAVWPPIPHDQRIQEEEATLASELEWLLDSLQETLAALKSGLEECIALIAPQEPGATLVISTSRSESVKGFVTRVGTRIVKGDINLRLQTLPPTRNLTSYPLHFSTAPTVSTLVLTQLTTVRNLINQALDIVDVTTWTGDAQNADFISGQLRLLLDNLQEARKTLKSGEEIIGGRWWESPVDENVFDPPLPPSLSFHLSVSEASLVLHLRTLMPTTNPGTPTTSFSTESLTGFSLRQRLGLVAKVPDHDETNMVFAYRGQDVTVREKVRVESQDPSLMAIMAKLGAMEHSVGVARSSLAIVMGVEMDE